MRPDGPMRARYARAGGGRRRHAAGRHARLATDALQTWRLARMFRDSGVDVVHCHDVYTNWFAGSRPGSRRAAADEQALDRRATGGHLQLSRVAYRRLGGVLANSDGVAPTLVEA
jgi:hypothetical protein